MESFTIAFYQLFQFLVMLLTGFIGAKAGVIQKGFLNGLAKIITMILMPVLIFANATNGTSREDLIASCPILLYSGIMYGSLILIFYCVARLLRLQGDQNGVYRAAMIFGNAGFLGIPLLTALFPERGAVYVVLTSMIDQSLMWTYALRLTTPASKKSEFQIKSFINPAVIAVLLSVLVLVLNLRIPDMVTAPLLSIGRAATPLSLIYLGALMCYSRWTPIFKRKELYFGIVIKMLLFPLLFYTVASALHADTEMAQCIAVIAGLPSMTVVAMFAQSQQNHGDYALGLVLATTIASLGTIMAVSGFIF